MVSVADKGSNIHLSVPIDAVQSGDDDNDEEEEEDICWG